MTLNILPKWQNVAESGHTGLNTLYPNRLEGGFCDFPVSTFLPSYLERYVCFCLFLESKMLRGESCKRRRRKRNLSWKDAEICFEKKTLNWLTQKHFLPIWVESYGGMKKLIALVLKLFSALKTELQDLLLKQQLFCCVEVALAINLILWSFVSNNWFSNEPFPASLSIFSSWQYRWQ